VAVGCLVSIAAARYLEHLIFGIRPTDSATFLASAGMLLLVAIAASVTPAMRILRLNPAQTLRRE
jgi:putative ABC transport system permease protein